LLLLDFSFNFNKLIFNATADFTDKKIALETMIKIIEEEIMADMSVSWMKGRKTSLEMVSMICW
jgi:hypothetical protein